MSTEHRFVPCPKCAGTGRLINAVVVGKQMREKRRQYGVSLREVARRMGLSAPYVSDLELGRRNFKLAMQARYEAALKGEAFKL